MSFDRLAPHYLWMEKVLAGEKLQRCRTAFLPDVAEARNILICGEGSGRFLAELLRTNTKANIVCLDASSGMLEVSSRNIRTSDRERIQFVQADMLVWPAPASCFDLIVTNFFLDCFREDQLTVIAEKLAKAATPQANWLLSDFHKPSGHIRQWRARVVLWLMYRFFRVATSLPANRLVKPDGFLERHGFRLVKQQLTEWGLLRADLWRRG